MRRCSSRQAWPLTCSAASSRRVQTRTPRRSSASIVAYTWRSRPGMMREDRITSSPGFERDARGAAAARAGAAPRWLRPASRSRSPAARRAARADASLLRHEQSRRRRAGPERLRQARVRLQRAPEQQHAAPEPARDRRARRQAVHVRGEHARRRPAPRLRDARFERGRRPAARRRRSRRSPSWSSRSAAGARPRADVGEQLGVEVLAVERVVVDLEVAGVHDGRGRARASRARSSPGSSG